MSIELHPDQALIADWIDPGSRILDLGCGDGRLLAELHRQRNVSGYGIEIDPRNIVKCIANNVNVIHSNLDDGLAEFDDDSFDYVIMTQTLQAVRYPHLIIREMVRIGRQGIVTFPNMGHWRCRVHLAMGKMPVTEHLPNTWYNTPNIHICTIRDFEEFCHDDGIDIMHRTTVDTNHRGSVAMRWFPNLLGEIALYRVRRTR